VAWPGHRQELIEANGGLGGMAFTSVRTGVVDTVLLAKTSVARLAESILGRLCKRVGGSAYTWYTPLGAWFEDMRALGYLRPPWSLAYDQLYTMGWDESLLSE
jgi:hypothetical protein